MANYGVLLARVQNGPPLVLEQEQHRNLERLNELRRQFLITIRPAGGLQYLLNIIPDTLNAVEHLLTTQHRVNVHFEEEQNGRIRAALSTIEPSSAKTKPRTRRGSPARHLRTRTPLENYPSEVTHVLFLLPTGMGLGASLLFSPARNDGTALLVLNVTTRDQHQRTGYKNAN